VIFTIKNEKFAIYGNIFPEFARRSRKKYDILSVILAGIATGY